ncbi:gamma-glutamyltransferase [Kocuria palustris]|uniref:gamma-glutamyltransferase n=1 Tax=Kocuria palustris TaxID=71999 RepID=UPI00344D2F20
MTQHSTGRITRRSALAAGAALGAGALGASQAMATAPGPEAPVPSDPGLGSAPEPLKLNEAVGTTAAVSCVDPYASDIGLSILQGGGSAMDAAVAMAAALGVTEPYSCGIGGGGFLLYRDAATGLVHTIDGRETAPMSYTETQFTDASGAELDFDAVVNSGLSIGVPGTPAMWALAAERFGTLPLGALLEPAEQLARRGFGVDQHFHSQTDENAERFSRFPETARVFLRDGSAPEVGSTFANPDLAEVYRRLRTEGIDVFYRGDIGAAILAEANAPSAASGQEVQGSPMTPADLACYSPVLRAPTVSAYRGMTVFGMPAPSSGGVAVGEILNLLEHYELRTGIGLAQLGETDYLHRFSEACATAFADRNRWVGDVPDVPHAELLSEGFAAERAEIMRPSSARPRPIPFGWPDGDYTYAPPAGAAQPEPYEGQSTTHLNVVDQWGNAVSYTLTIEQTGGSGITVPGHGFLLNNELTDFSFVPVTAGVPDPNLPGPGKRPRSSMAPTILTDATGLRLCVGTPGGATIITSVAQIITGHFERGLPLVDAIAAARLSSRNDEDGEETDLGLAESPAGRGLTGLGHHLVPREEKDWLGNASGISREAIGLVAAAETVRGGGGAARTW